MRAPGDTSLRPGVTIDGRFTLKRQIGSGACGAVWLASDRDAKSADIVLKILHPFFDRYSFGIKQLAREADVLAQLGHPNIAKPFAFSASGVHCYLAMEFIDGRSLDQEIGAHTRTETHFPSFEVSRIFLELCSAVSHAHSRTIIHRDLKPQNVMIVRRGTSLFVKVLDFGIAKLLEADALDATTFGRRLGSMFYMAPEQCVGHQATIRSDVFALGVILFEILTLRRAWAWDSNDRPLRAFHAPVPADGANSLSSVILRIATAPRPRVSDVRPGVPAKLDRLVLRAMAIDPSERFGSVDALAAELSEAIESLGRGDFNTELVTVRGRALNPARATVAIEETAVFASLLPDPDATEMHPAVEDPDPDTTAPQPEVVDPELMPEGATVMARAVSDPGRTQLSDASLVPDPRVVEPASTELMYAVHEPLELGPTGILPNDLTPAPPTAFRIAETAAKDPFPVQVRVPVPTPKEHPTLRDPPTGTQIEARWSRGATIAMVVALWLLVALLAMFITWLR